MRTFPLRQEVVVGISGSIDRVGLCPAIDELVIIGGNAMAAFGIKTFDAADLDIVGTNRLIDGLEDGGQWKKGWEFGQGWEDNSEFHLRGDTGDLDESVSLLRVPLDSLYHVSAEELIAEAVVHARTGIMFSPPVRLLDWKLALVESDDYLKDKTKHVKDAELLSEYLLMLGLE